MVVKFGLSNEGKKLESIQQHTDEQNTWKHGREIDRRTERVK